MKCVVAVRKKINVTCRIHTHNLKAYNTHTSFVYLPYLPFITKFIIEIWSIIIKRKAFLSEDTEDNQDLIIMGKVALVHEWLNKDNNFNFAVVNEVEHNLEEFTHTKQNRWINMFCKVGRITHPMEAMTGVCLARSEEFVDKGTRPWMPNKTHRKDHQDHLPRIPYS